jgi:hypothetical protein
VKLSKRPVAETPNERVFIDLERGKHAGADNASLVNCRG